MYLATNTYNPPHWGTLWRGELGTEILFGGLSEINVTSVLSLIGNCSSRVLTVVPLKSKGDMTYKTNHISAFLCAAIKCIKIKTTQIKQWK